MSLQESRYVRTMRQVLYGLKRQYGDTLTAYKLLDAETNYETGVKTIQKASYEVIGVVIPTTLVREVLQSISQISANKTMVYGGSFDSNFKTFILDGRNFPSDFDFTDDDWIVYKHQRFEIKEITRLDYQTGWIIQGQAIVGQHAEEIYSLQVGNALYDLKGVTEIVPWSTHHTADPLVVEQSVGLNGTFNRHPVNIVFLHTLPTIHAHEVEVSHIQFKALSTTLDIHQHLDHSAHGSASSHSLVHLGQDTTILVFRGQFVDSEIDVDQSVTVQKIASMTPLSTIGLGQTVSRLGIFNRDITSPIGTQQDVTPQKVIYRGLGSTLTMSQKACDISTDLISAWFMDETSGIRYDTWGDNDLADINTVDYTTGIVNNAAHFVSANSEQLIASNDVTLQTGDIDFWFTGWLRAHANSSNYKIWGKWDESTNDREYMLRIKVNGQLMWGVSKDGISRFEVSGPTLEVDVWHFICCYHDSVNNELGLGVNMSFTTRAYTLGVHTGPADFTVSGDADLNEPFEGDVEAVHFWKRMLTPTECAYMWNDANGRQIPPFCV